MAPAVSARLGRHPFIRQGLPVMLLTALGGLVTGAVFERMTPLLEALPGLIVLVPPIIGLRGNINASLGSRLGSATHLGLIAPGELWGPEVAENVNGSLALSTLMPALAAVVAYASSRLLGLPTVGVALLVAIAVVSGIVSGVILAAITLAIIFLAYRYGLDPDNLTGPGLATIGDVITVAVLYTTAVALGGLA